MSKPELRKVGLTIKPIMLTGVAVGVAHADGSRETDISREAIEQQPSATANIAVLEPMSLVVGTTMVAAAGMGIVFVPMRDPQEPDKVYVNVQLGIPGGMLVGAMEVPVFEQLIEHMQGVLALAKLEQGGG